MKPVEHAARIYESEPCARTFKEDLEAHLIHGVVFSRPDLFIMARPVSRSWAKHEIVNPWFNELTKTPNCWHVYLAAGDISKVWSIMPYRLEFASWERGNKLRFWNIKKLQHHGKLRTSPGAIL